MRPVGERLLGALRGRDRLDSGGDRVSTPELFLPISVLVMAKDKKKKKKKDKERLDRPDGEKTTELLTVEDVDDTQPESPTAEASAETRRASVGRGSLAERILDSLEAVANEIERVSDEVTALGSSLRLARDQLAEQEEELESLHALKKPRAPESAPGRPTARKTTVPVRDRTSAVGA
jgi:hypothetical protein